MSNFNLAELPSEIKSFLRAFLIVLSVGVFLGIYFVQLNTSIDPNGIIEHYNGTDSNDEFEIKYGKSLKELVLTTHNHIISFVFIFVLIGIVFLGVQNINPKLKLFLLIEPFISIILTFGSMFLIRYVHSAFVALMILSSTAMYLSYFAIIFFSLKSLK